MRFHRSRSLVVAAWLSAALVGSPQVVAVRAAAPAEETVVQATSPAGKTSPGESVRRSAAAADPSKKHVREKEVFHKKVDHGFTPEREAAALTFVNQYHPELARLLTVLKTKDREEYHRAVRDLFRTSERLAVYREKYPARYDLELKAWQIRSRIQLLATRLKLTPEDERLSRELRDALLEQADLRLDMLRQDRGQLAERLKRLDAQIDKLQEQRELDVDRQLGSLLRTARKKTPPPQKPREPGKDEGKRPKAEPPG